MRTFAPLTACSLAALVCCVSCSTPEERADRTFSRLVESLDALTAELALVTDEASAEAAVEGLEERCDELWDALAEVDALGDDPELPQEARSRVGKAWHEPFQRAVEAALQQAGRLSARKLYHSPRLQKLARQAYAHYSSTGRHPWPRAVLKGREYRPKTPRK